MSHELLFKLTNVDEKKHVVRGIATLEKPDLDGEICDYESAKTAYKDWSSGFLSKTAAAGQGLSMGNVRLMHGAQIGGKVVAIDYDDVNKAIIVDSEPATEQVWDLIRGGFITGYSHGGKKRIIGQEGIFKKYAPIIRELSYVDYACSDQGFELVKSSGEVEMRKFVSEIAKREFSDEERSKLAGEGKALPDGSFPIENESDLHNAIQAIGRAKDPAKAKAHIRARAKALGRTDLLPDSWNEKSEKFATGEEQMTAEEKKQLDDLQKGFENLTKMTEAQNVHLKAMKAHHEAYSHAMGEHLNAMCSGDAEKMAKIVNGEKLVSIGTTSDGVEVFKKVAAAPPIPELADLTKRVEAAEKRTEAAEKESKDLTAELIKVNKSILESLGKGVVVPGVVSAAAVVVSKEKDGADGDDKNKNLKKFTSSTEIVEDKEFLKLKPMGGNELAFFAARDKAHAATA